MDALLEAALRIETYKHECRFCERRFKLKCNCVRHERIHTNERPHKCRICLRAFILKKNMQDHERVHTLEKPYQCGSCSRRFSRRNSMVRHARIHTGEKPYSCDHCHKSFAWKAYLKRHFLNAHVNSAKKKAGHEEKVPHDAALLAAAAKLPAARKKKSTRIEVTSSDAELTEVKHTEKIAASPVQRAKTSTSSSTTETKRVIVRIPKSDYCKELKGEETFDLQPMREYQFNNLVTKRLFVRVARCDSDGENSDS